MGDTTQQMFLPNGQPPGYQYAAWAAAGLRSPPTGASSAAQGLFFPHPGPTGSIDQGGVNPTYDDYIEAAVKTWKATEKRLSNTAALLQQALDQNEALEKALNTSNATHTMAQHTIAALQGHVKNQNEMSATIEQLQHRVSNLEATLASVLRHQALAETRGAPPWTLPVPAARQAHPSPSSGTGQGLPAPHGEAAEQDDSPLMKRFRAITWKSDVK